MGSNSTTRAVLMIVALVLILLSSGAEADSSDASPPAMARRGSGPLPTPPPKSTTPDQDCPLFLVPGLIDACRRSPGPRACAAQCLIYHYRGGFCDMLPNGRPGDCFCINCLSAGQGTDRRVD